MKMKEKIKERIKVSGFTIIRNGTSFDYPYLQSLESLLPLVDELVINVGYGDDDTLEQIKAFQKKHGADTEIVLFESHWPLNDPEKKKGGQILAEQTNLALQRCSHDWCLYLQADEILHEEDTDKLKNAFQAHASNPNIQGLLFNYEHFYGSYDVVKESRSAYRREVRIIKKSSGARSVGDAQSFRLKDGTKLKVAHTGAKVYHYGWVRSPEQMKEKTFFMDQLYHGDPSQKDAQTKTPHTGDQHQYRRFWGLKKFSGTHPQIMQARIEEKNWNWDFKSAPWIWKKKDFKNVVLDTFERFTGVRLFEYRCYRLIRPD
jgi:hypothetical protein